MLSFSIVNSISFLFSFFTSFFLSSRRTMKKDDERTPILDLGNQEIQGDKSSKDGVMQVKIYPNTENTVLSIPSMRFNACDSI